MVTKKKRISSKLNCYLRSAERDDIGLLVKWIQHDDYRKNILSGYPLNDKGLLKEHLLKEIALSNLGVAKSQLLIADINNQYQAGLIGLQNIDWQNRHCDLQFYISPEFRKTELSVVFLSKAYEYIFGILNFHKIYIYEIEDRDNDNLKLMVSKKQPEALLKNYYNESGSFENLAIYAIYKRDILRTQ